MSRVEALELLSKMLTFMKIWVAEHIYTECSKFCKKKWGCMMPMITMACMNVHGKWMQMVRSLMRVEFGECILYLSTVQISIADLETRGYNESVYIKNTHKCCWWLVGFHAYFRKAPNESLRLFQAHFTAGFMHDTIRHTCPWHHVLIVAFLLLLAGHQAHRPPMWELTQLTFLFLCTGCDSQDNSTESIHQG